MNRSGRRLASVLHHLRKSEKGHIATFSQVTSSEKPFEFKKYSWWGDDDKQEHDSAIKSFKIDVQESILDDLKARLNNTRFPPDLPNNRRSWDYGMEQGYLSDLVEYWRTKYNWRAHESRLNEFPHFQTNIDGIDLHFIHVKSGNPDAIPLLITHGWPGSVWEFEHIIPLLASDESGISFDVIAPSIPGYGWSSKPTKVGYNTVQTAVTFSKLMKRLGYENYIAQGGDWGATVTTNLALVDPEHCKGIHINMVPVRPPKTDPLKGLTEKEIENVKRRGEFGYALTGYLHEQSTKPHTLGFPLSDSPAGLAAWIVEKFHGWSDCNGDIESRFTKDELLTNVMIYWITNTATSSCQYYKESLRNLETGSAAKSSVGCPAGIADFPAELYHVPRLWAEQRYKNLVSYSEMPRGGHFAAREEPSLLASDIRLFCEKAGIRNRTSLKSITSRSVPSERVSTPTPQTDVTPSIKSHGRYDYSPIRGRKKYTWPGGKKLALYIGLNLEHFEFGKGQGAKIGAPPNKDHEPDILNYAWRDYGNRVGVWRLLDLFDELKMPVSLLINTSLYDYCPSVIAAFRERGDEVLAHGHTNSVRQGEMDEETERCLIKSVTDKIVSNEGKHPAGWLGPWISQSNTTVDLLKEEGYSFVLDWCHDDQPIYFTCRGGKKLLSVPYQQEINDIPAVVGRKAAAKEFTDDMIAGFDEFLRTASQNDEPLVYGIALHPYIVGQPHRLKHLRDALTYILKRSEESGNVWVTKAGDIAKFVEKLPEGIVP